MYTWALADISKELHTVDYIVSTLGDKIPIQILPMVVFIIAAITAFDPIKLGVMAILMPLVIPFVGQLWITMGALVQKISTSYIQQLPVY